MSLQPPCLFPGCSNPGHQGRPRCLSEHWCLGDDDTELSMAEAYALASILYYEHDISLLEDWEFDSHCAVLLHAKAWQRVHWLVRALLIAGTGFGQRFPQYIEDVAAALASGPAKV